MDRIRRKMRLCHAFSSQRTSSLRRSATVTLHTGSLSDPIAISLLLANAPGLLVPAIAEGDISSLKQIQCSLP
jgi:hypothetical protein